MRYALYFTPPADDPLTRLGAHWLGRDAFGKGSVSRPASMPALTKTPARYGFHATIKAPFELADGKTVHELQAALSAYCEQTAPLRLPPLTVAYSGNSFILGLESEPVALQSLAADVVRTFDRFRAPLSAKDFARRNPDQLTESQLSNLREWGYPHVMTDFRFHMTLTGPVEEERRSEIKAQIVEHFAEVLSKPLLFSGLGLFVEPARGEDLSVFDWQAFRA